MLDISNISLTLPKGNYYSNNNDCKYQNHLFSIENINNLKTYNGNKWCNYRLGDTIGGKNHDIGHTINDKLNFSAKIWPNSIVHKYLLLMVNNNIKYNDFNELNKLLDIHCNDLIMSSNYDFNYIAIHVRVGDGISWRCELDIYKNIPFEKYKELNINDIIIFCGSHNNRGLPCETTIQYLKDVIDILTNFGFNVYVRSGNSPDDDLYLMVKAKYFMPGGQGSKVKPNGGGYNSLVRQLRYNYNIITNT
jgi:hypothetical protein